MARACSPLRRLPAPVRVGWPAMLAAVVVLGGACGGGTKTQPGGRSAGGVAPLRVVATTVLSARMRDLSVASPALGATVKARLLLPVHYRARPGHLGDHDEAGQAKIAKTKITRGPVWEGLGSRGKIVPVLGGGPIRRASGPEWAAL